MCVLVVCVYGVHVGACVCRTEETSDRELMLQAVASLLTTVELGAGFGLLGESKSTELRDILRVQPAEPSVWPQF